MGLLDPSKIAYPARILLIDDDRDIRDIYEEFLTQAGFRVEVAKDGQEGLAKIRQGGYDLILLDIMMPKINGLGILKTLKENPNDPSVYNGPIVVLSVLSQESIIKQALEQGAKGYLIKSSVNPDEALNKISEFLKNSPNPTQ